MLKDAILEFLLEFVIPRYPYPKPDAVYGDRVEPWLTAAPGSRPRGMTAVTECLIVRNPVVD